jgi:hypothetical protein
LYIYSPAHESSCSNLPFTWHGRVSNLRQAQKQLYILLRLLEIYYLGRWVGKMQLIFPFWGQNLIKLANYIYFKLENAYFITSIAVQQLLQKLNTSFCLPHWEQTRLAFLLLF